MKTSRLPRGLRFVLFAALFLAALGFGTRALWNWLMPTLFGGPAISLLQTYGLLLLSRLLLGGFGRGGARGGWARHRAWKRRMTSRMHGLSPEEKENFRQQMRQRCGMGWGRRPAPEDVEATAPAT